MTRINYWCYLQDNKITGKMEIRWGVVLFVGGQRKRQHTGTCCLFDEIYIETIRAEICYTCIYLDFAAICYQKIIIFIFVQIKISKFLQINISVRGTHRN